jgi:hypothetical protein
MQVKQKISKQQARHANRYLQAQHQRPKVSHRHSRLAGETDKIILAHRRELSVVPAACVTKRIQDG